MSNTFSVTESRCNGHQIQWIINGDAWTGLKLIRDGLNGVVDVAEVEWMVSIDNTPATSSDDETYSLNGKLNAGLLSNAGIFGVVLGLDWNHDEFNSAEVESIVSMDNKSSSSVSKDKGLSSGLAVNAGLVGAAILFGVATCTGEMVLYKGVLKLNNAKSLTINCIRDVGADSPCLDSTIITTDIDDITILCENQQACSSSEFIIFQCHGDLSCEKSLISLNITNSVSITTTNPNTLTETDTTIFCLDCMNTYNCLENITILCGINVTNGS